MSHQRYSYFGLIIAILALAAAIAMIVEARAEPLPVVGPAEHALEMQCDEVGGTFAVSYGDRTWVECWKGKRLWAVKL